MIRKIYRDIRRVLLIVTIIVPMIPFLSALFLGYTSYRDFVYTAAINGAERVARGHAALISSFLEERRSYLGTILFTTAISSLRQSENLAVIFEGLSRNSGSFIDIGLINADGVQVSYAGPYQLEGKNYAKSLWFQQALSRGSAISDVYLGYRQKAHFTVAVSAVIDGEQMVLRATVDQNLFGSLVEKVNLGRTGEAYLVNQHGILQTAVRSGGKLLEHDPPKDREKYIYVTASLNDGAWFLTVRQSIQEIYQDLSKVVWKIIFICFIGGLFIVILAVWISNKIIAMIEAKEQERTDMEKQLFRASRLAELGEISAGFAHEINNPLQIMKSEIALMQIEAKELDKNSVTTDFTDSVAELNRQIDRCGAITRSILDFSRKNDSNDSLSIDIKEFLYDMRKMISHRAESSGIHISCTVPSDLPKAKGDSDGLQQVTLNIMNNAIQSIEEKHGNENGELHLSANITAEQQIEILIEDNGKGISAENLEKIFNPFFTTKLPGKGTGLGLSVSHSIMSGMDGSISARSEEGQGATFILRLPVL